jgi:flagellar hook-length control protein FliK
MNNSNKSKSHTGEPVTVFDELFQQTNGTGKEKEKAEGLLGMLNQCVQIFPMVQKPIEQPAPSVIEENFSPLHNQTPLSVIQVKENPLFSKQNDRKVSEQTALVEQFLQDQFVNSPSTEGRSQTVEKTFVSSNLLTKNEKESNKKEEPQAPPLNPFISADPNASLTTEVNKSDAGEKPVFSVPVRVEHIEKDVARVLQSAIHVRNAKDEMETTFSLHPNHLGTVDVKLSIKDGIVKAEFLASTSQGKDLLQSHVQALHTALEQQGFQVDKIDIFLQNNATFTGMFSQKGDSHGRQEQSDSRKQTAKYIHNQDEEYPDFAIETGWGSQINTTA